jgi:hypothetical protein
MLRLTLLLILAAALPAPRSHAAAVTEFPAPAADTGESSLVTGPDGTSYLTYNGPSSVAGERALWLATLAPGATTWSEPRAIVSTPQLMENWADFASLVVGTDGQLWAQWFQRRAGEDAPGYDGWVARSRDGGATWTAPAPLGHEFVSLAPLSGGRVLAVWLENPDQAGAAHGAHAEKMRLKSRLLARDGTTLQDWVVDPDVCTCCQTSLARLGGDRVVVAYRGHTPGEIRDNHLAFFNQSIWGPPRLLHADGWKIPACPVNGPAADARGEALAVAWFTAANGVARVQAKVSRDGGITFSPALALDLGRPIGRLDLVQLADGSSLVSWLEARSEANAAGLYVRRLFPDGGLSAPLLVAQTSAVRASGFARMAARTEGDGLTALITWTDATPGDPANPKSAATTRVRLARLDAGTLHRTAPRAATAPPAVRIVVRSGDLAQLEICEPTAPSHPVLPSLP